MSRSSRHKSYKHGKHSYRDYSDSEEDVKMERSYRDENPVRSYRDSASGEKRKILSQVKDGKDLTDHGNGQVFEEEYVATKRRKEKSDVSVGGDRWNGGVEQRGDVDRNVEKETNQRESMKIDSKSRESITKGEGLKIDSKSRESICKGESLKIESKSKSKRYETSERKDGHMESAMLDKDENKSKGESKRKSEKDSSARKEKESKDKERKSEKEKIVRKSKHDGDDTKFVDIDVGKKHVAHTEDINDDKQGRRSRSTTERATERNPELEKEIEKRIHRRKDVSSEREKHLSESKEANERQLSSKGDHAKETKHRDDKHKDVSYSDKHQEDGDKEARHRDVKREDSNRDHRRKDEKLHEDRERDKKWKDDKYMEGGSEREHRDEKYHDDSDGERRRKDDRYRVDGDMDNSKDERYYEDGERDDRRKYDGLREDGDRDNRQKDGNHREDTEQDTRHKDRKSGEDLDSEKRQRNSKYRNEYENKSRDRYGDKSDPPKGDSYAADHHSRKSIAYDDSPTQDDRSVRYRDEQSRRKTNENGDYGDVRSRSTKDQRSNDEKKNANGARMDTVPERGRSTSRNADIELSSGHSRRRNSPGLSSHDTRDQFRVSKKDESKYREINYEERVRHSTSSTRDYIGTGGSEKTSPWSLDKHGQKGDGHLGEICSEKRLKSDIRPSPLQLVDKSPSSSADKRQFSRPDRRSTGFRDANEYSGKEGRTSRELPMNVINGDEFSQADTDTLSVSSPFTRNSHFSNSSKLFPPSHFRTGMDSPLPINSAEDESRGKLNNRQRRIVDPNMGRMQGNAWRGMPSWPSPMANGFLPFPHAPPPLNFMQPFPSPPIFGVRPSMDLNHSLSSPYHPGQVHNMGWRNQVGDSFSAWDASNSGFVDESHNCGRPNWDISRNLHGDLWKVQNKTESLEMPSSEKENNLTRSGDDVLVGEATKSEQTEAEQQAESVGISQSSRSVGKNDIEAFVVSQEAARDVAKPSGKGDLCLSCIYLSRLDISADLVEPEIFEKCAGLIDVDETMLSEVDDFKILCMKEALEANVPPANEMLSYTLFPLSDDTIFQKAMSLYKKHRSNFKAEAVEKLKASNAPNSDQEDQNVKNNEKTEKVSPVDYMQGVEDSLTNFDIEVNPPTNSPMLEMDVETSQQKIYPLAAANIAEKSEERENVDVSDDSLPPEVKEVPAASGSVTKSGPFLDDDDVLTEVEAVVIQESVVSNLSRIHHSPESTH